MNSIPQPEARQLKNGSFQLRWPGGSWRFCREEHARPFLPFNYGYKPFPSPQQRAEERKKEAIASLASEISSDLAFGEVRKVYQIPSQGLALVFSDSVGNGKIDPNEWIYQRRGRRFISLAIAPLEADEDPFKGAGARARAEIVACDRSCHYLSHGAIAHHGRTLPASRQGKNIAQGGSQCYVAWNQIRAPINSAKRDPSRVPYLPLGRETLWRLTSWGDLSVLPFPIVDALLSGIEARGGWGSRDEGDQVLSYSNAWREGSSASPLVRERLKRRAMASVSTIIEFAEAIERGWEPFYSDNEGEDHKPLDLFKLHGRKVIPCLATAQNDLSCAKCRVCRGDLFGAYVPSH